MFIKKFAVILSFLFLFQGCKREIIKEGLFYYDKNHDETSKDSAEFYEIVTIDSSDNDLALVKSFYKYGT